MGGTPMLLDALRRHYEQGCRAKRSQFGAGQDGGQVLCRQGVAANATREGSPRNEANFGGFQVAGAKYLIRIRIDSRTLLVILSEAKDLACGRERPLFRCPDPSAAPQDDRVQNA